LLRNISAALNLVLAFDGQLRRRCIVDPLSCVCEAARVARLPSQRTWGLVTLVALCLGLAMLAGASCTRDAHGRVVVRQGDCFTCHQANYDMTTMPPHPGLFPTSCGMCHTETEWVPAQPIQHDWFVLANRHTDPGVRCTSCHTVGFALGDTPTACVGCHQDDYDGTTAPPHPGSLPTDCASCHTDAGWVPSTFMHSWPLDGAHVTAPCASCHGDPPTYVGTPTTCIGCHADRRAEADVAVSGHSAFATTCGDCHTTTAWLPAIGGGHPETEFPISRGAHSVVACLDCHNASLGPSTDGMNTDCIGCHEHANAARDHGDVAGYPASPPTPHFCLDCHPNGRN
jgi:hypothetical protein